MNCTTKKWERLFSNSAEERTQKCAARCFSQHSTAQHSTAQHSTAQHSTAQHSTAQDNCVLFTASKNYIKSDAAGGEGHSIVECLSPSAAFFYAKKFSHYLQRE